MNFWVTTLVPKEMEHLARFGPAVQNQSPVNLFLVLHGRINYHTPAFVSLRKLWLDASSICCFQEALI
jgi:hypothetical protein